MIKIYLDHDLGIYVTEKEMPISLEQLNYVHQAIVNQYNQFQVALLSPRYTPIYRGPNGENRWFEDWMAKSNISDGIGHLRIAFTEFNREYRKLELDFRAKNNNVTPLYLVSMTYPADYYDKVFKDILKEEEEDDETQKTEQERHD